MLMRLRPRRFASYSAASARAYHSALLSPACHSATPIESVIRSIVELQAAINRYLAEHNRDPRSFVWSRADRTLRHSITSIANQVSSWAAKFLVEPEVWRAMK
jgi:hypothetical protein